MLTIRPTELSTSILLTAVTPVSHFDPATGKGGNTLSFNRRRQIVARPAAGGTFDADSIAAMCAVHPIPVPLAGVFEQLAPTTFAAAAILRAFLDAHNSADGIGHFQGVERYEGWTSRVQQAAIRSDTLPAFWSRLSAMTGVGAATERHDAALHALWALPLGVQSRVIRAVESDYVALASIARAWHGQMKLGSDAYAEKAGRETVPQMTMSYMPEPPAPAASTVVIDVPYVSTNDIRHQLRAAGMGHMFQALGIQPSRPGYGEMPHAIAALFENGGNLEQGAKQPGGAYQLAADIRARYPLLALLGGNVVSFDLGESDLAVRATLVCAENAPLEDGLTAGLSAFDLLDDVTETRQASLSGYGQMIRNFETLAVGTQLHVACSLNPFAPEIVRGALVAAVETWLARTFVAGQRARGYGHFHGQVLRQLPNATECLAVYEAYLLNHAAELRGWLADGTLGTGKVLAQ